MIIIIIIIIIIISCYFFILSFTKTTLFATFGRLIQTTIGNKLNTELSVAESLKSLMFLTQIRNPPNFMKHEGSLQCSQEPATCPYPESHPLQKISLGPRLSIPLRENDKLLTH